MISVIIPSKTASNLDACVGAKVTMEPCWMPLCIIDDGIGGLPDVCDGATVIPGEKPFIFARNCNAGISVALLNPECNGVVLLNDDAILKTPGGFTLLAQAAAEHPEYGIIAATSNAVGNLNQRPQRLGLREDPRMVCFIAVYIPRATIERVGLLDERFTGYGFEDDDYCLRVRRAGLKVGIHDGCFVDHGSLKSTFRGAPHTPGILSRGREIFVHKWGSHPL